MNILTSIEEIVKGYFGELFENIEAFYLKNFLILIQGLLTQTNRGCKIECVKSHSEKTRRVRQDGKIHIAPTNEI